MMILKNISTLKSSYNYFDLLGSDENALSKAFAYLISMNRNCFFAFIQQLGISIKNTESNYRNSEVLIQKYREEGITDIEIVVADECHVIVECKIKKGKVIEQRSQYIPSFIKSTKRKILCLLTELYDSNIQNQSGVTIVNMSWYDIISLVSKKELLKDKIVLDFIKFAERNYTMTNIKEILIQGLSHETEVKRFLDFNIYKRDQTFGSPLYFAPYFSKKDKGSTYGIIHLSKILGIITAKASEVSDFISEFDNYTANKELISTWKDGLNIEEDIKDTIYTYYFLEKQFEFKNPLVKDGGIEKGRGKNWIAANIPKNRCVTFVDLLKHIPGIGV